MQRVLRHSLATLAGVLASSLLMSPAFAGGTDEPPRGKEPTGPTPAARPAAKSATPEKEPPH